MSKELEQLIQQKFDGASSHVPAGAWSGVSAQIGSSAGVLSSVLAKVIIGAAIVGGVTIGTFVISNSSEKEEAQTALVEEPENTEKNTITPQEESTEELEAPTPQAKKTDLEPKFNSNTTVKKSTKAVVLEETLEPPTTQEIETAEDWGYIQPPSEPEIIDPSSDVQVEKNTEKPELVEDSFSLPTAIKTKTLNAQDNNFSFYTEANWPATYSFKWYLNDELAGTEAAFNPEFEGAGDFLIMLRIYNKSELSKTLYHHITIEAKAKLVMPNIFTPHSSLGYNDVFDIDHERSENINWYQIEIYNGLGNLIYTSTDANRAWNGYASGEPAEPGKYIYRITYKSENGIIQRQRGEVLLQR